MNVVAYPRKNWVTAGADDHVKVALRTAIGACVALALQANALSIACARLDAELDRFGPVDQALPVTGRACVGDASRPTAARAGNIELHAPAHLRNLAGTAALRAGHGSAGRGLSVAGWANLLAANLDARIAAANGRPEVDGSLIFEVGAWLRAARTPMRLAAREDAGEDVSEAAPGRRTCALTACSGTWACTGLEAGKVEPAEVDRRTLSVSGLLPRIGLGLRRVDLVGVEAYLVVDLALLLVRQHIVGLGDFFELLLGLLVIGVDVGMILARQLAEGLPDLLRSGRLLDAENAVIILILRSGHVCFLAQFDTVSSHWIHRRSERSK